MSAPQPDDIWALSGIGAWVGIYYNQCDRGREPEQTINRYFMKRLAVRLSELIGHSTWMSRMGSKPHRFGIRVVTKSRMRETAVSGSFACDAE